jgi:hypothetical protein
MGNKEIRKLTLPSTMVGYEICLNAEKPIGPARVWNIDTCNSRKGNFSLSLVFVLVSLFVVVFIVVVAECPFCPLCVVTFNVFSFTISSPPNK